MNWKILAANFGRIIDRINDDLCDRYNNGALAGIRNQPRPDDPVAAQGWADGQRERRVVVVMPERPEGYYHAPIGTFD